MPIFLLEGSLGTLPHYSTCDHLVAKLNIILVLGLHTAHNFVQACCCASLLYFLLRYTRAKHFVPNLTRYHLSRLSRRVYNTFSAFGQATDRFLISLIPDSKSHVLHRIWLPLFPRSTLPAHSIAQFKSCSKQTHPWILNSSVVLKGSIFPDLHSAPHRKNFFHCIRLAST